MTIFATLTGRIELADPEPGLITSAAIAHSLAQINRWAGAAELPISVAQHSLLVRDIFCELFPDRRRLAIHALLHDAHEYLIGDVTRPTEAALAQKLKGLPAALHRLKAEADALIYAALGVRRPSRALAEEILAADICAADLEWRLRLSSANGPSPFASTVMLYQPRRRPLPAWTWIAAADNFRAALDTELRERRWEE